MAEQSCSINNIPEQYQEIYCNLNDDDVSPIQLFSNDDIGKFLK